MEYNYIKAYRKDVIKCEEAYEVHNNAAKHGNLEKKLSKLFDIGILKNDESTQYILSLLDDNNVFVKAHIAMMCVKRFSVKKFSRNEVFSDYLRTVSLETVDKITQILNPHLEKSLKILKDIDESDLMSYKIGPFQVLNLYTTGDITGKPASPNFKTREFYEMLAMKAENKPVRDVILALLQKHKSLYGDDYENHTEDNDSSQVENN
jgi:hypothetical protein